MLERGGSHKNSYPPHTHTHPTCLTKPHYVACGENDICGLHIPNTYNVDERQTDW